MTESPPFSNNAITLKLPEGVRFSDLKLRRCDDAAIDMDMDLITRICQLNGWDVQKVQTEPGPIVSTILSVWYRNHLEQGGQPDPVMESLRPQRTLH